MMTLGYSTLASCYLLFENKKCSTVKTAMNTNGVLPNQWMVAITVSPRTISLRIIIRASSMISVIAAVLTKKSGESSGYVQCI